MSKEVMRSLSRWAKEAEQRRYDDFGEYVTAIAEARYVMRKVTRTVDEEAKRHGLDSLEHQAMLQAYGAGTQFRTVSQLADRLDVAPALVSRVVNTLVNKGLVTRRRDKSDKRIAKIEVSDTGAELLRQIDRDVHIHLEYFQAQLSEEQRLAALSIFTFYIGIGSHGNFAGERTAKPRRLSR